MVERNDWKTLRVGFDPSGAVLRRIRVAGVAAGVVDERELQRQRDV